MKTAEQIRQTVQKHYVDRRHPGMAVPTREEGYEVVLNFKNNAEAIHSLAAEVFAMPVRVDTNQTAAWAVFHNGREVWNSNRSQKELPLPSEGGRDYYVTYYVGNALNQICSDFV